jgi:hypothetical protein
MVYSVKARTDISFDKPLSSSTFLGNFFECCMYDIRVEVENRRGKTEGISFLAVRASLILIRNPSGACRPIGMRPANCALQRTRLRLCRAYSGLALAACCCVVRRVGLACQYSCTFKSSKYILKRLLKRVQQMEQQKAAVRKILQVLGVLKL